jgi:hypothetical protein
MALATKCRSRTLDNTRPATRLRRACSRRTAALTECPVIAHRAGAL